MIVKVTFTEEHIKGATMNVLPSELLIISAALHDFSENEERNMQDRVDAEKMIKDIHFAFAEKGKNHENDRHRQVEAIHT